MTDGGRRGWTVVGGSFLGAALGATVLVPYSFGYLIAPLAAERGWARDQFASAVSLYMLTLLVLLPFAGRVIDRLGARRAAAGSMVAMALVFLAIPAFASSLAGFHAAYVLLAFAAVGASPLSYARAVTSWFDRRRGLALGVALCGVGLGTALLPSYVQMLIGLGGWQAGYMGVAGLLAVVGAPVIWFTVREQAQPTAVRAAGDRGLIRQAMGQKRFWKMLISFFLLGLGISGVTPMLPAILEGRGADVDLAVKIQACLGLSSIIGRLAGGWLMDKIFAPWVTVVAATSAAIGLALLLQAGEWGLVAAAAGVGLGLATGMESDVIAYLSSRYFPSSILSTLLGIMVAAYLGGAAIGPLVLTLGERWAGDAVFLIVAGLLCAASLMQLTLGRYARPE
ncbi:MFS transporter [Brevundimonas sp.]|uniref:MFS transporter n=1 Tax=Brevundimonas sp. TaxID=1871086 RepID=UPI0025BA861D|nr:MFS transporter [Brevundimonas sp.]